MAFLSFVNTLLNKGKAADMLTFQENRLLLTQFLQSAVNTTIRVYIGASSGYGHQANTVNIIKRFAVLGFAQNMQIIYDDAPTIPTTIQKLAKLIPGLNPGNPQPVVFNGITLSFITKTAFAAAAPAIGNFGFTGGYDANKDNLAKITNTKVFLKLQPFEWSKENRLYLRDAGSGDTVSTNLADVAVLGGAGFNKLNYYLPIPAMTANDYVAFTASDPTKVAPYTSILAACSGVNPAANMMPVYGVGDVMGDVEAMMGVKPESILYNLIASVAYAQDFSDVAALQKGAIIVVIASVSSTPYNNLQAALNGTTTFPDLNAYSIRNSFATRVNIINFDDVNFDALLLNVQQNRDQILVIKMNGLPGAPFNYLYNQSTLPSMFEGKGTASLALNLPVPFYFLNQNKAVYPSAVINQAVPDPMQVYCNTTVARFNENFKAINDFLNVNNFNATSIYALGQFLWKLSEDGQAVNTYFDSLPAFFHQEQNDKLLRALFYMLHTITE